MGGGESWKDSFGGCLVGGGPLLESGVQGSLQGALVDDRGLLSSGR